MKTKKLRPNMHLWRFEKQYPSAYRQMDHFRSAKASPGFGDWPDWCYLPVAAAYAVVSGGGNNRLFASAMGDVAVLSSLAAWRTGKSIYRFDDILFKSLIETPVQKVPVDILYRLPEWGLYIETPGVEFGGEPLHGFFCHLEHDFNNQRPELRLLLDAGESLLSFPLHMTANTVEEMFAGMLKESIRQQEKWDFSVIDEVGVDPIISLHARLISLVLYLCSESPDFKDDYKPKRAKIIKRNANVSTVIPKNPEIREVGFTIGKSIRKALESSGHSGNQTGRSVGAHIRDAHWHSFWSGPRDGDRKINIKWLPPIPVATDKGEVHTTTVKKVH